MVEMVQGRDVQFALAGAGPNSISCKLEEPDHSSAANRYFSRDEIEKNSPSRKDGIDLKKETYLRKSYCTFLQDLGMRLKV
jgi:cyclin T